MIPNQVYSDVLKADTTRQLWIIADGIIEDADELMQAMRALYKPKKIFRHRNRHYGNRKGRIIYMGYATDSGLKKPA